MTGPRYMLLSALAFAFMGAMVKIASTQGLPLLQIIFVRALISVFLSLIDIRRCGAHPLGKQRGLLLARGLVGFLSLMARAVFGLRVGFSDLAFSSLGIGDQFHMPLRVHYGLRFTARIQVIWATGAFQSPIMVQSTLFDFRLQVATFVPI